MKTKQIPAVCPYCGDRLVGRVVICPVCKTPHHQNCWQANGGCTTLGCAANPQTPNFRVVKEVSTITGRTEDGPPGFWDALSSGVQAGVGVFIIGPLVLLILGVTVYGGVLGVAEGLKSSSILAVVFGIGGVIIGLIVGIIAAIFIVFPTGEEIALGLILAVSGGVLGFFTAFITWFVSAIVGLIYPKWWSIHRAKFITLNIILSAVLWGGGVVVIAPKVDIAGSQLALFIMGSAFVGGFVGGVTEYLKWQ